MFKDFYTSVISASIFLSFITLLITLIDYFKFHFSLTILYFSLIFDVLIIFSLLLSYRSARVGYLLAVFSVLTEIRILGINQLYAPVLPLSLAFFSLAILFFYIVYHNSVHFEKSQTLAFGLPVRLSPVEWHLTFVRLYLGFDFIAHFAEKFPGFPSFQADVQAFTKLGIGYPAFFVMIAALFELFGAVSIGFGCLARLGAVCMALYLLVATYLGNHFHVGFIWGIPGGGWEYPLMWMLLILSFSILGAGKYSLDSLLQEKFKLPVYLEKIIGSPFLFANHSNEIARNR